MDLDSTSILTSTPLFFQGKVLISSLRLEPAVFIFYICYGVFFVTNQQLYIEKACKVWCPSSSEIFPSCTLSHKKIISLTTSIAIMIVKVNLAHNASVCDNLGEFPKIQTESQKLIAAVQVMSKAVSFCIFDVGLDRGYDHQNVV